MLYSVVLGDQNHIANEWDFTTDDFKNNFFSCKSIYQRLRIQKKDAKEAIVLASSNAFSKVYYLPQFISFQLSNKNLTPTLLNWWNNDEEIRNNHVDEEIAYITLNNKNYKLVSYCASLGVNIIGTYRKKDAYQGCVLKFQPDAETDDHVKISINAFDYKANRFVILDVSLYNGKVEINKIDHDDIPEDVIRDLYKIHKKSLKKMNHFKIDVPLGTLLTRTYITTPEKEGLTKELTKDYKGADIIVVPDEFSEEELLTYIKEKIAGKGIRAVTTVGVRLPYDVIKDLKLSYIFDYDEKFQCILSVKSN